MKTSVRFLLAFALVAGAGCSSDGGPDYATEIDEENMGGAAEEGYGFVSEIVYGMMEGSPSADIDLAPPSFDGSYADRMIQNLRARGLRRSGRAGELAAPPMQPVHSVCVPVETGIDELGDPIDSDGDGVPNDYKISFPSNCTETEGEWTYTYSGSIRARDVAGLYGYRLDIANMTFKETNNVTDDVYIFKINGTESALYAASGADHSTHLSYVMSSSGPDAAPGPMTSSAYSFSINFSWDEETSFDPEGTISLDADIPDGDFDIDLTFRAFLSGEGENAAFRFHLTTPEALHFESTECDDIDNGQLRGALNDSEDIYFLVTWNACATTTYESHGTSDGGATVRKFAAR